MPIYAQVDSTQVYRHFDNIQNQINQLQSNIKLINKNIEDLDKRDTTKQNSIADLTEKNNRIYIQIDSLKNFLSTISNNVSKIKTQITDRSRRLSKQLSTINRKANLNATTIVDLKDNIKNQGNELSSKISNSQKNTSEKITHLASSLSRNTLYWIISILAVGLITIIAFLLLRKKVNVSQSSISENIANTRIELEEETIRLDNKLVGIMDTQLKVLNSGGANNTTNSDNQEMDHSLALKVADEIVRIEKNLSRMDEGTKGLKQLAKAVERIKDNFAANGYEMVDLIGKPFDDGMKLTANFIPDDNLKPNEQVITRIIKPQINYKGQMIQSAQVEVSQGLLD